MEYGSVFADPSNRAAYIGLMIGLGAVAMTLSLVVAVFALRWSLMRQRKRRERMTDYWKPILFECLLDRVPAFFSSVPPADSRAWVRLWISIRGSVRGEAAAGLNAAMHRTGIDAECRRRLTSRSAQERLVSVVALGFLGDERDWAALRARVDDPLPIIGISAASALVRIRPDRGVPLLLDVAPTRVAWHSSRVLRVLCDGGADAVTDVLCAWMRDLPAHLIAQSVPYLAAAHPVQAQPVIIELLATDDIEVLCACLRLVDSPFALARVRTLTTHADWRVRLHAATALGRVGDADDRARLIVLLADRTWWVRLRAARALLTLPGVEREFVEDLSLTHPDAYARDMLVEALAREA